VKKHLLLGASFLTLAVATPAQAAPPALPTFNWSGWYAGVNIGYSWGSGNTNYTDPGFCCGLPTSFSNRENIDGIIGGGQTGYNWQVNNLLFGLEADIQDSGEKSTANSSNSYTCNVEGCLISFAHLPGAGDPFINQYQTTKIEWFGTVRGRAGVLVNPTLWVYGTGGLAYGNITVTGGVTDTFGCAACSWSYGASTTRVGWTVGAGVEGVVPGVNDWTWKVEYLYIDFGTVSGSGFEADFGSTYTWSARVTDNILRVGFNRKFP
jgi:outer membrane immunogenic protein